jgi:hypothetical protein
MLDSYEILWLLSRFAAWEAICRGNAGTGPGAKAMLYVLMHVREMKRGGTTVDMMS